MKNGWATLSRVIAWVSLVCGILGGIIGAIGSGGSVAVYIALGGIFGGLVSFCLFGILADISEKVNRILSNNMTGREGASSNTPGLSETPFKTFAGQAPMPNPGLVRLFVIDHSMGFTVAGDTNIYLDDSLVGTLHSEDSQIYREIAVPDGAHKLKLINNSFSTSKEFTASNASLIQVTFKNKKDQIEISSFKIS